MTDRELLEAAAKAAGIDTARCLQYEDGAFDWPGKAGRWNPITDDGDALRLAGILRINIEHAETLKRRAYGVNCWPVGRGDCAWMENVLTDYAAAVRRAIVRAAAEIGRSKTKPTTTPDLPEDNYYKSMADAIAKAEGEQG